MHRIFVGVDEVGEFPWHLGDGEELPSGDVRWRFVARTDDDAEAARIMGLVSRRCFRSKAAASDSEAIAST
jgi:hypothetical protein